ncbi:MAG TPA: VOC family protein [Pseudolysinimonas sp.]|nr:VOC family protein [Pseudolysinimonas sp.]
MTDLTPYLLLPGTAREALTFYASVFGGEAELHEYGAFGRTDGPADAIAHGELRGPVRLFAADAGEGEQPLALRGVRFALLGTAGPATLRAWFEALADGASEVDALQRRPWGDVDGTLTDRFGVPWLIGYTEPDA